MIQNKIPKKEQIFLRIKSGIYFDKDLKMYSKETMSELLELYLQEEEYEKCSLLQEVISTRFNHDFNYKSFH